MGAPALSQAGQLASSGSNIAATSTSGGVAIVYLFAAIAAFFVAYIPARRVDVPKGTARFAGIVLAIIVVAAAMHFNK